MGDCGQNGRPVNPSLIDLPPELLLIAIGLLSAADQRRLAKTCTLLRAAVLQQAKQLQLDIGSHDYPASAALLAAIRREHGPPLHLELRFRVWFEGQHINVMKELSALGTCPAVHQLELACIARQHKWTCAASMAVVQMFPNLKVLVLSHCRVPLTQLAPMLQRPEPLEALQIHGCGKLGVESRADPGTGNRPTPDWPAQLLSFTGFRRLEIPPSCGQRHRFPRSLPSNSQLSGVLTHVVLGQTQVGLVSDWLQVMRRLPALEVFHAREAFHIMECFWDLPTAFPRLHTLRLPLVDLGDPQTLKAFLSHPSLKHLQLRALDGLHDVAAAKELLNLPAGKLQKLELGSLCCAAFTYLPDWALNRLVLSKGCTELCLCVDPFWDIPGFTSADIDTQVDWRTVDTAVARLGPRLARLCPALHVKVHAGALPDRDHPQLSELCTSRVLQLAQRLQPLSAWEEGVGVKSATLVRYQHRAKEVEALQAALGPGCKVEATSW